MLCIGTGDTTRVQSDDGAALRQGNDHGQPLVGIEEILKSEEYSKKTGRGWHGPSGSLLDGTCIVTMYPAYADYSSLQYITLFIRLPTESGHKPDHYHFHLSSAFSLRRTTAEGKPS